MIEKADDPIRSETQEVEVMNSGEGPVQPPAEPEPADASDVDKSNMHDESTINILHTNFNTDAKETGAAEGSTNRKGFGGIKRSLTSVVRLYKEPLDADKIAIARARIRALYPMNDVPILMLFPSLAKSVHRVGLVDVNKYLQAMRKGMGIADPDEPFEMA